MLGKRRRRKHRLPSGVDETPDVHARAQQVVAVLVSPRRDERVSLRTLDALVEAGMSRMSFADFQEFREVGLFRDDVEYDRGVLVTPDGIQLRATFSDPEQRAQIAKTCLGENLRNGVLVDAGFFFGPKGFYAGLRELPAAQRRLFAATAPSACGFPHR